MRFMTVPSWLAGLIDPHFGAWNPSPGSSRGARCAQNVAELFSSDFTLIVATLAGLALTSLGILHDLGPLRLALKRATEADLVKVAP